MFFFPKPSELKWLLDQQKILNYRLETLTIPNFELLSCKNMLLFYVLDDSH